MSNTGVVAVVTLAAGAVPVEMLATVMPNTGPLATVTSDTEAVAPAALAAHPGVVAEGALAGDAVATDAFATDGVAGGACGAEAVAAVASAAHPVPADVLAPVTFATHAGVVAADTLAGDTVATDGVAGGACGVETFASGARHMTILSRFAGRTLCSDFAAAVRRASWEDSAVLNPGVRRGRWHGPATGIP
ncbi:hypothetical protein N4G69_36555 [Streptomyces mirabilis]|uniref:hypothetical protein n=1 Tax=Streptomyces mirabilis TaxID=68239 RepID=UPI0021C18B42|nr:hypothetical protein [Streptomyces mirabilis]MCT9111044.1 hypothetical protein [Streptomyces mirabilis]